MVIKAGMGSSPLAVVPYTFSLISQSISYGTMVIIYNNLMNVLQIIILKGKVKKSEVAVQILSSFCFGYCLDLSMMLLSRLAPSLYVMKLLTLLIACVIIAFGSYSKRRHASRRGFHTSYRRGHKKGIRQCARGV